MRTIRIGVILDRVSNQWLSPSAQLRVIEPLGNDSRMRLINIDREFNFAALADLRLDAVLFQRLTSTTMLGQQILDRAISIRIPVFLDIDDDFEAIFESSEHSDESDSVSQFWPILANQLPIFERVWCSTPELEKRIRKYASNTRIRSTLIPLWAPETRLRKFEEKVLGIAYFGTPSHKQDWNWVADEVCEVARLLKIKIHIVGLGADVQKRTELEIHSVPEGIGVNYRSFFTWISGLLVDQIAIAPLYPSRLNSAKSALKMLEAAAMGSHPLASEIDAYQQLAQGGMHISFARTKPMAWSEEIRRIAESPQLDRYRLRIQNQKWIREHVRVEAARGLQADYSDLASE